MLRSWRAGFYLFFCWLMVEDLPRKYMGNNLALFFGKDILLALVYIALFREIRSGKGEGVPATLSSVPQLVFLAWRSPGFQSKFAARSLRISRP
jgi:hypothetical protein